MAEKDYKLFGLFPPVSTEEWESRIMEDLKGADYAKKLIWRTPEGFEVKPYYRSGDLASLPYSDLLPGDFPFVRGYNARGNDWEIRQDINESDPIKANAIALDAISRGATGIGFGVSGITDKQSLTDLLKGIDFDKMAVHFGGAASYPAFAGILASAFNEKEAASLQGSFDFDPLSNLLLEGKFSRSESEDFAEVINLLKTGITKLPAIKVININGQYFRNSGSTVVQELAFSLAMGNEYLAMATGSGISADEATKRMMFTFGTGSDYFTEIAKLRAARQLWAQITEQYKPGTVEAMKMYIHCISSGFNKTLYDPYVNILRTTTETMSAIAGGAQCITVTQFDTFYKEPDEFSNRIARNQQIILKEEAYLDKVADPAAGSYYIESLTDSLAKAAWELFLKVENQGGMLAAIKAGFIQDEVAAQAARFASDIATRKMILLGTNQYPNQEEMMLEKIEGVDENSSEPEDDMETPVKRLEMVRLADSFDDLRLATEAYVAEGGKRPAVFLFTIGNLAMRKARAMFTTNFFGCAGYQVIDNPGFATAEDGIQAALHAKADIVVICSSDEEYDQLAVPIAQGLKSANDQLIVAVAGYPKELLERLKEAGVDEFIHVRSNLLETLESFHEALGIYSEN